ncbi:MAG: HAD-IC family P-type ATPase [Myxococcota bacterium]|nr:HAD-IC family P-type ATPase [Myxococcota bacterium]
MIQGSIVQEKRFVAAHQVPFEEVATLLDTDPAEGLDAAEVTGRRLEFGPNRLTPKKGRGPIIRFLLQFHAPLVYILLAAGIVTAVLSEWVDAGVILGVVLVNAIVGFVQESKALTAIDALSRVLTRTATIIRQGEQSDIPAEDLVPGDIVLLQSGDKVPADLRLFHTRNLRVDESALTGESVPVQKDAAVLPADTVLADRKNMAYSSALVTYGTGKGVVTAIGDDSEIGRIASLISASPDLKTPLTRRIERFSNVLLVVILVLAALTFGIGLLRDQPLLQTFLAAVALAVGAIPEGLPAAVTIMLAIGVARMARRRAIIRRLPAVETLGSTTVICTDKTGTLTHNQMTVRHIATAGMAYEVRGQGYEPRGEIRSLEEDHPAGDNEALSETIRCGALCNDAILSSDGSHWKIEGDPTEGALLVSATKGGLDLRALKTELPRIDAIPFESDYQYMATLHKAEVDGRDTAYLKGAVESVIARCGDALGPGGESLPLHRQNLLSGAERLACEGLRVLAFAKKDLSEKSGSIAHSDIEEGCTFLGLQAMIDPPREEAAQAVASCKRAGIQVKMITGDHATTALAIASEVGIVEKPGPCSESISRVHTGAELEQMETQNLAEVAGNSNLFARVTPESKLRLVEALQSKGHVVAMTGDGVNDAPALRRADIGVAMALGGTEVARDAAAMVLTDDNFATIEAAVAEGRSIFDNLIKFIVWTLPTNIGQGLVLLAAIVLGTGLPILPAQALWINMTTVVALGTMLAFEPREKGIMQRPPRDPKGPLLPGALAFRIVFVAALICVEAFAVFQWELGRGAAMEQAQTATAGFIVVADILYLLSCRSLDRSLFSIGVFTNPWIWIGACGMSLLQLAFTYLPAMNAMFHTVPMPSNAWGRIGLLAALFLVVVETEKQISRAFLKRSRQK